MSNPKPQPARPKCIITQRNPSAEELAGLPLAPAVLIPWAGGHAWQVLCCPHCGATGHQHSAGPHGADLTRSYGQRLAHCIWTQWLSTSGERDYNLQSATLAQETAIRAMTRRIKTAWRVIGRQGNVLSRHRTAEVALKALERWRQADPWATIVNVRIEALQAILAGEPAE